MTSASWCSGTGSCLVLSSSWSLSTMAITQLRHLATFAHSLSWKSQMHNQQSDQLRWLHLCLTHTVYLWDCEAVIFFAQSKLRKAKRSKGNVWKDILRLLLKRFHRFKLSLSSPELLQVTDVLRLFSVDVCAEGGWGNTYFGYFLLKNMGWTRYNGGR